MILSKDNLKHIKAKTVLVPDEKLFGLPEKVLQFGTGVLLRSLPDYFIDQANRNGIFNGRIVIVKSTSTAGSTGFEQQDNLYTLCVRGIEEGKTVEENIIISAVSRVIAAEKDWGAVLEFAGQPDFKLVISNTTEAGISLLNESIYLQPPVSFPAKLLAVLYKRYQIFEGSSTAGLVVIATELIPDNGKKLQEIVEELARFNALGIDFIQWMQANVEFCNSLVDRIVPGKPDRQTHAVLEEQFGYQDGLLCIAEPYRLWAIEGSDKAAALLDFARTGEGIIVTRDIEQFKELKVRLLNGTHTLSCGIAVLAGISTVKNGMENLLLKQYISTLMKQEIAPAIPYPLTAGVALEFADRVSDRFANSYIDHLWMNITAQYTMKMKIRVLPVLLNYYRLYASVPKHIAFGFAAFLHFMKSEKREENYFGNFNGREYQINDDHAAYFYQKIQSVSAAGQPGSAADQLVSGRKYAAQILNDNEFWKTDLNALPGFTDAVYTAYESILKDGISDALATLEKQSYT
jgi:tagaturonate reductase